MPGYMSHRGVTRWKYVCYAIELDPRACADPRSTCRRDADRHRPVYVGQTKFSAADRLEQHLMGFRASRWVTRYGRRLLPHLTKAVGELESREAALRAEAALARRLGGSGYCVYGGH